MTDIKIGDKYTVYGYIVSVNSHGDTPIINFASGEIGTVFEIGGYGFGLDIKIKGYLLKIWPHLKQCRRLVKMKKCDECNGLGLGEPYIPINNGCLATTCATCDGKGRMKPDRSRFNK